MIPEEDFGNEDRHTKVIYWIFLKFRPFNAPIDGKIENEVDQNEIRLLSKCFFGKNSTLKTEYFKLKHSRNARNQRKISCTPETFRLSSCRG